MRRRKKYDNMRARKEVKWRSGEREGKDLGREEERRNNVRESGVGEVG